MRSVLLVALLLFAADKPKPKPPGVTIDLTVAGTNVWAKWTVAATPSDSLTVDVNATGQAGTTHRGYLLDSKTDSVSYPKPSPGASITVSILATNWRGTNPKSAPLLSKPYIEPDTVVTPPTVQLQVTPTSGSVVPGGSFQFQASTNSGKPVTWRVVGVGTVSATGLYTAPL